MREYPNHKYKSSRGNSWEDGGKDVRPSMRGIAYSNEMWLICGFRVVFGICQKNGDIQEKGVKI